jgi:hypothetical protein
MHMQKTQDLGSGLANCFVQSLMGQLHPGGLCAQGKVFSTHQELDVGRL